MRGHFLIALVKTISGLGLYTKAGGVDRVLSFRFVALEMRIRGKYSYLYSLTPSTAPGLGFRLGRVCGKGAPKITKRNKKLQVICGWINVTKYFGTELGVITS